MAEPSPYPDTGDDTGMGPGRPGREYPGMPRWVKLSGIIAIGLVLLIIVALVVASAFGLHSAGGPGGHGP